MEATEEIIEAAEEVVSSVNVSALIVPAALVITSVVGTVLFMKAREKRFKETTMTIIETETGTDPV